MAFAAGMALAPRSSPTLSSTNSSRFLGTARSGRPAVVASRRVAAPVMKSDPRDGQGADMERLKSEPATIEDFKAEISPKSFWSNIGFTPYAERQVGRSAMLGFFIGLLIETVNPNHPTILSQAQHLLNVPANLHALQVILTPGAVPPV
ncbi:hypothetical protein MMPV_005839 [Pyropia vietnamensis]